MSRIIKYHNFPINVKLSTECIGNYSNQATYIALGLVGLSKAVSDDQFYEITDKIPGLGTIHKE